MDAFFWEWLIVGLVPAVVRVVVLWLTSGFASKITHDTHELIGALSAIRGGA